MLDRKEEKRREHRRKKYKFALVRWADIGGWEDTPRLSVERKDVLAQWWAMSYEILCDWEPERVLRGMLKLLKENGDG